MDFWHFLKSDIFLNIPTSSFVIRVSFLFLAFLKRCLVYVSCSKWDYRFDPYRCAFFFIFNLCWYLKLFLIRMVNIPVVGNAPRKVFCFLLFPKTHLFGRFLPFSEAKVKFWGSKLLVQKKCPSSSHHKK